MNTVSRRIHKHLRPRASSRKQMFMGRSSKQCIVNWSLWLFSSVDSWFPGHRPLRGRGMASLKQVQLLIDTNVQTGSFMITATYSPQSERTRAGAHERVHTDGHTKVAHTTGYTQTGTHDRAHTWSAQVGGPFTALFYPGASVSPPPRALPFAGLEAPIWFSGLACCYSRASTAADPPHGPEQKPQSPPCRMSW